VTVKKPRQPAADLRRRGGRLITIDANGDAIVTSGNAVPTTRTSAVASLPMTTKLFDGWSAVSVARGANK